MPHCEHVIALAIVGVMPRVLTDVVIVVRNISSRSGNGRRVTYWRVVVMHTVGGIDSGERLDMRLLLAFE